MSSFAGTVLLIGSLLVPAFAHAGNPTRPTPKRRSSSFELPPARPLAVDYVGPELLRRQLDEGLVRPTALATGDFDEDGVPDLVSAYASAAEGLVTLHRGNVDAIYPHSPEARARKETGTFNDAPFLTPAWVFEVPAVPDFLGAGDFDNDGHRDVVAAARGGSQLYLLRGDGDGGLGPAHAVPVAGRITAMIAGEICRKDNLADVVVGIDGKQGPAVLVFEGPAGALDSIPEVRALPAAPTALELGRLDDDVFFDLAVAVGPRLMILHGWNNFPVHRDPARSGIGAAVLEEAVELDSAITAIAVGRYVWDPRGRRQLALLSADGTLHLLARLASEVEMRPYSTRTEVPDPWEKIGERPVVEGPAVGQPLVTARVSGLPMEELVILDHGASRLQVTFGEVHAEGESAREPGQPLSAALDRAPVAALPMRLNRDALSDLVLLQDGTVAPEVARSATRAVIIVNESTNSGPPSVNGLCRLSEAIVNANWNADLSGGDCAAGSGADVIEFAVTAIDVLTALPPMTDPGDTIDGTTACGSPPCVELRGSTLDESGLRIADSSGNVIRGLVITDFDLGPEDAGIELTGGGNSIVEGNTIKRQYGADGLRVIDSSTNTVGGTASTAQNTITENWRGVVILATAPGLGSENEVLGNYIGTDASGTTSLGNWMHGIFTEDAAQQFIGGSATDAGNVISGNGFVPQGYHSNVYVSALGEHLADGTVIQGNVIGLDPTGTVDMNNASGMWVRDVAYTSIGGAPVGARNIVAGNGDVASSTSKDQINIASSQLEASLTTGNLVQRNYIGTNITGTGDFPHFNRGVALYGGYANRIGGPESGLGNLISGNGVGIVIQDQGSGHRVEGNLIGTDVTGESDLGNVAGGIGVWVSYDITIGGTDPGARNIIACNGEEGVWIAGGGNNRVLGNYLGTDITGTVACGNGEVGVNISGSGGNTVGGTEPGSQNLISGNSWWGVWIHNASVGNEVLGNLIGTDATGTRSLGNTLAGVVILEGSSGNTIGGIAPEARNVIAYNLEEGVLVSSGNQNAILGNSIFSNGLMGIDLGPSDGVTSNDPDDPDTGPNGLQNFPDLSTANATPAPGLTVEGTLDSTPDTDFRIEFFANRDCDDSDCGEGERFLGFSNQHTDPNGDVSFSLVLGAPVSDGESIVATATDPNGNTSEFGGCFTASCSSLVAFGEAVTALDGETLGWTTPTDIRFAKGDLAYVDSHTTIYDGWVLGTDSLDLSADNPGTGDGLFYLVKPLGCGSWQTAIGAEPGRDAGLP